MDYPLLFDTLRQPQQASLVPPSKIIACSMKSGESLGTRIMERFSFNFLLGCG